jgi:4-amino-4-deoxy-L-arabinose transferase-like glycosyltransferase
MRSILAICALHVLACLYFLNLSGLDPAKFYTPDSWAYDRLAVNLIENQVFSVEAEPPFAPYTFRTPLYPYFLATHFLVFGRNPIYPVLVQIGLNALTIFLLFNTGRMLLGWRTSRRGCILLALSGVFILHSLYILTESLYAFLLSLVIYSLAWFLHAGSNDTLHGLRKSLVPALMGFLLGVLTLCKPSALFFSFVIAGIVVAHGGRAQWRASARSVAVAGICLVLVLSPWFVRNLYHFQTLRLDTVQGFNLYYTTVASMRAKEDNLSLRESMDLMRAEEPPIEGLNEMELDKRRQQMAVAEFLRHPIKFSAICLYGVANTLSPISPKALSLYLGDGVFESSPMVRAGGLAADGRWREALGAAFKSVGDINGALLLSSFFFTLLDLAKYWLCFLAVLVLWRGRESRTALLVLLPVIIYFIVVTGPLGPQGAFRYRFPIEPYLSLLAASGLGGIPRPGAMLRDRLFLWSIGIFSALCLVLLLARLALGVSMV